MYDKVLLGNSIKVRIEEFRSSDFNQRKVAEKVGVTEREFRKIIKGEKGLTLISFIRLCKALEVDPGKKLDEIIGGE